MLYQDKTQTDFLPNTQYLTGNLVKEIYYDWSTYGGFGVDISGTINGTENLQIQGSVDGVNWTTLFTVQNGAQVTNNLIVNADLPGHFICNVISYPQGKIVATSGFTGNVKVVASITVLTPPEVASVL